MVYFVKLTFAIQTCKYNFKDCEVHTDRTEKKINIQTDSRSFHSFINTVILIRISLKTSFSSIVQVIFSFWSFEISEDILGNQKLIIDQDSFSYQCLIYLVTFR